MKHPKLLRIPNDVRGIFYFFLLSLVFFSIVFVLVIKQLTLGPEKYVSINDYRTKVEIADSPQKIQLGLSGRSSLPNNQGMLFLLPSADNYTFWMSKMKFNLDFIFINKDFVVFLAENIPYPKKGENPTILRPEQKFDKVLEVNQGIIKKAKVKIGDRVDFFNIDLPSLPSPTPVSINPKPIYDRVVKNGSDKLPWVALTFDADMTPYMAEQLEEGKTTSQYNKKVIEILEAERIPATLFLSGLWIKEYPEETRHFASNPLFELGNHSYSHPAFSKSCFNLPPINDSQKDDEFRLSSEIFEQTVGYKQYLFRFPGGCYTKKDLQLAKKYKMTVIGWSVDGKDAFNTDPEIIFQTVKKEVKNGSILIFHLNGGKNAPKTDIALPRVTSYLREKGYQFVKISQLLANLEGAGL